MNCVAICITQQAHRCSGELQVPSVRPSVAFTRAVCARTPARGAAGRLESYMYAAAAARGGTLQTPTHAGRIRSAGDRAAFSLNLLACPSLESRLRISVFQFFLRSSRFSPRKKLWRRRTKLGKPRCRDPQKHQCRDPQKHQCLHSKTPLPAHPMGPRPNAYTREFPKLTCVGIGPRPC